MNQEGLLLEVKILSERINHLGHFAAEIANEIRGATGSPKARAKTGVFIDGLRAIPIGQNLLAVCEIMEKLIDDLEVAAKKVGDLSDEFYKDIKTTTDNIGRFRVLGKKITNARRFFKDEDGLVELDKHDEVH
jgi:hypothetical protein